MNISDLHSGDGFALKEHLIDELDYNLLPEEAWLKLVSWYGVVSDQHTIQRKVVEHGMYVKNFKVEVYLMEFKLSQHSDPQTFITRQFSKGDTVGKLYSGTGCGAIRIFSNLKKYASVNKDASFHTHTFMIS